MPEKKAPKFKPGDLVSWRYVDYTYLGIVLSLIPKVVMTKKYLTFWQRDSIIIECYEDDIEKAKKEE